MNPHILRLNNTHILWVRLLMADRPRVNATFADHGCIHNPWFFLF